jgi:hypothetical protein
MKAWLVTWEWSGPHAEVEDRVAAVLRPRTARDILSELVETIYKSHTASLENWCEYAKNASSNPYRAEWDVNNVCRCGHNPFLVARYVIDLRCITDPLTGLQKVNWKELPRFERVGDTLDIREVRGALAASTTRNVVGPLSDRQLNWRPLPRAATGGSRDSRECLPDV